MGDLMSDDKLEKRTKAIAGIVVSATYFLSLGISTGMLPFCLLEDFLHWLLLSWEYGEDRRIEFRNLRIRCCYTYSPTGRIARRTGEETLYYHTDHLGSIRIVTDTSGSPEKKIAFGMQFWQ